MSVYKNIFFHRMRKKVKFLSQTSFYKLEIMKQIRRQWLIKLNQGTKPSDATSCTDFIMYDVHLSPDARIVSSRSNVQNIN